ncbi:LOG family protein [Candidatus Collierbacteria bacterium]|nr:LOG family protein [Candidatus Collierbacteria bacterium]
MVFYRIKAVSLFGFASCEAGSPLYNEAFEVARFLAENNLEVVNGGGPGVMRAATEGAHAGGGKVTIATFYPKFIENFEGKDPLNKADREVILDNYLERTMKLLELGNAYVIFNGGTGTLSELGMAWGLAYLYMGHHKPLILYGSFWHEVMEILARSMLIGARPESLKVYKIATTPEDVVRALEHYDNGMGANHVEPKVTSVKTGEEAFMN